MAQITKVFYTSSQSNKAIIWNFRGSFEKYHDQKKRRSNYGEGLT